MKNKILIISFLIIYGLSLISLLTPDQKISFTERRYLKEFPSFKLDSEYSKDLESYLLDHFAFRDTFRKLKAEYNYHFLLKEENNDVIFYKNGIYKTLYPLNYQSLNNYLTYLTKINELLTKDNMVYISIVPDKNYYLSKKNFLKLDYETIYAEIKKLDYNFIDIRNTLNLDSYYLTDTHWKEEKLEKTVNLILTEMGITPQNIPYKSHSFSNFKGVYYNEAALNSPPDTLIYLTSYYTDHAQVNYLENKNLHTIYNTSKLNSFDPYEIYLDGASSYIEINNSSSLTNRELIIFRDSFGSSITPLLIPYFKKITVIDNRYIGSKSFINMLEFTNQDILFLNSTLLINESFTLKK